MGHIAYLIYLVWGIKLVSCTISTKNFNECWVILPSQSNNEKSLLLTTFFEISRIYKQLHVFQSDWIFFTLIHVTVSIGIGLLRSI